MTYEPAPRYCDRCGKPNTYKLQICEPCNTILELHIRLDKTLLALHKITNSIDSSNMSKGGIISHYTMISFDCLEDLHSL